MHRRRSQKRHITRVALLLALLSGASVSASVSAARAADAPRVSIGDVVVTSEASGAADVDLSRALRATLSEELARSTELSKVRRPVIVSVTLTKLSSEKRDERTKTSAAISLAVRRADDQVLFAELRGRASVEETTSNVALLRRRALEGAVRGAVARLPEALERSRTAL